MCDFGFFFLSFFKDIFGIFFPLFQNVNFEKSSNFFQLRFYYLEFFSVLFNSISIPNQFSYVACSYVVDHFDPWKFISSYLIFAIFFFFIFSCYLSIYLILYCNFTLKNKLFKQFKLTATNFTIYKKRIFVDFIHI